MRCERGLLAQYEENTQTQSSVCLPYGLVQVLHTPSKMHLKKRFWFRRVPCIPGGLAVRIGVQSCIQTVILSQIQAVQTTQLVHVAHQWNAREWLGHSGMHPPAPAPTHPACASTCPEPAGPTCSSCPSAVFHTRTSVPLSDALANRLPSCS